MKEIKQCRICLEEFQLVQCTSCDVSYCKPCAMQLLVNDKKMKCVDCKCEWNKDYLEIFFSKFLLEMYFEEEKPSCLVCFEEINDKTQLFPCNTCKYSVCQDCNIKYWVNKQIPKCMQCSTVYTKKYIGMFFDESLLEPLFESIGRNTTAHTPSSIPRSSISYTVDEIPPTIPPRPPRPRPSPRPRPTSRRTNETSRVMEQLSDRLTRLEARLYRNLNRQTTAIPSTL